MSSDGSREEESGFGRRMFMERQQLKMGEPVSYRFETGSSLVASDSQSRQAQSRGVAGRKPGSQSSGTHSSHQPSSCWKDRVGSTRESRNVRRTVPLSKLLPARQAEGEGRSLLEESCS